MKQIRHIHGWGLNTGATVVDYIFDDGQTLEEVEELFRSRTNPVHRIIVKRCIIGGQPAFEITEYN